MPGQIDKPNIRTISSLIWWLSELDFKPSELKVMYRLAEKLKRDDQGDYTLTEFIAEYRKAIK